MSSAIRYSRSSSKATSTSPATGVAPSDAHDAHHSSPTLPHLNESGAALPTPLSYHIFSSATAAAAATAAAQLHHKRGRRRRSSSSSSTPHSGIPIPPPPSLFGLSAAMMKTAEVAAGFPWPSPGLPSPGDIPWVPPPPIYGVPDREYRNCDRHFAHYYGPSTTTAPVEMTPPALQPAYCYPDDVPPPYPTAMGYHDDWPTPHDIQMPSVFPMPPSALVQPSPMTLAAIWSHCPPPPLPSWWAQPRVTTSTSCSSSSSSSSSSASSTDGDDDGSPRRRSDRAAATSPRRSRGAPVLAAATSPMSRRQRHTVEDLAANAAPPSPHHRSQKNQRRSGQLAVSTDSFTATSTVTQANVASVRPRDVVPPVLASDMEGRLGNAIAEAEAHLQRIETLFQRLRDRYEDLATSSTSAKAVQVDTIRNSPPQHHIGAPAKLPSSVLLHTRDSNTAAAASFAPVPPPQQGSPQDSQRSPPFRNTAPPSPARQQQLPSQALRTELLRLESQWQRLEEMKQRGGVSLQKDPDQTSSAASIVSPHTMPQRREANPFSRETVLQLVRQRTHELLAAA